MFQLIFLNQWQSRVPAHRRLISVNIVTEPLGHPLAFFLLSSPAPEICLDEHNLVNINATLWVSATLLSHFALRPTKIKL